MFGPFLDKTDGVTLETGAGIITSIDHATTGIFLSKNGATGAIRHQTVTASVLDAYGMFKVTLDTTDTDTVGTLRVMMAEAATFLPVWDDYMILPANVYDSLMGSDKLQVDTREVTGTAQTANDNGADINAILLDSNELQTDWANGGRLDLLIDAITTYVDCLPATLNNLSAAQINAQVLDVLNVDTLTELTSVPASTPTHRQAIMLLYQALRNKIDVTATAKEVHQDDGTVLGTKTLSDDGTTYSETKMA